MIQPKKFDTMANLLLVLNIILLLLSLVFVYYYYFEFPQIVPTHFNVHGQPDAWGTKSTFLILPSIQTAVILLILLLVIFRFTLVNKYPYLISLPGFALLLQSKGSPDEKKGDFINKSFLVTLFVALMVNIEFFYTVFPDYNPDCRWKTIFDKSGRYLASFDHIACYNPLLQTGVR